MSCLTFLRRKYQSWEILDTDTDSVLWRHSTAQRIKQHRVMWQCNVGYTSSCIHTYAYQFVTTQRFVKWRNKCNNILNPLQTKYCLLWAIGAGYFPSYLCIEGRIIQRLLPPPQMLKALQSGLPLTLNKGHHTSPHPLVHHYSIPNTSPCCNTSGSRSGVRDLFHSECNNPHLHFNL